MILNNIPLHEYHSDSAVSNSKLSDFRIRGPLFYKLKHIMKVIDDRETPALFKGSALDVLMTEGEAAFNHCYAKKPEGMNFSTKEGKQWKLEQGEREPLDTETWNDFEAMKASLLSHPLFTELMEAKPVSQQSIRHPSAVFGLTLQTRPDWLGKNTGGMPYINDLKTTMDFNDWHDIFDPASNRAASTVVKYNYHRQAALAQHICVQDPEIGRVAQFLTVVEKQAPYRCGVFTLDEHMLDLGFKSIERDLVRLKDCMDKDIWPNSPATLLKITSPEWLEMREAREQEADERGY